MTGLLIFVLILLAAGAVVWGVVLASREEMAADKSHRHCTHFNKNTQARGPLPGHGEYYRGTHRVNEYVCCKCNQRWQKAADTGW